MTRQAVLSTNVRSWGYDAGTKVLEVEMVGGDVFQYSDVPQQVADSIAASKDVRKTFLEKVKGKFSFERIVEHV